MHEQLSLPAHQHLSQAAHRPTSFRHDSTSRSNANSDSQTRSCYSFQVSGLQISRFRVGALKHVSGLRPGVAQAPDASNRFQVSDLNVFQVADLYRS